MTLPAGNPVVSGTTVASSVHNNTTGDIANEISDSLSRSGRGPMLAALKLTNGTVAAPGVAFNDEAGSGLYRAAAGDVRAALLGVDALRLTTGASAPRVTVTSPQAAGGTQTDFLFNTTNTRTAGNVFDLQNNGTSILRGDANTNKAFAGVALVAPLAQNTAANAAITVQGNKDGADAGSDVIVKSTATRTAGSLLELQNNATAKFRVDYNGEPSLVSGLACGIGVKTDAAQTDAVGGSIAITGMSFPVEASAIYEWEAWGPVYVTGGGSGILFEVTGPAAPTLVSIAFRVHGGATVASAAFSAYGTTGSFTGVGTAPGFPVVIHGTLVNGANAGTVAHKFGWGGGGVSASVNTGWFLRWRRIA